MKQSAGTIKSNALSTCKRRSLNTTRFFSLQRSVYNQSPFFSPATSAVYRQKHSRPLRFASQPVSLFSTSFRDDSSDNDSTAEHRDGDRDGVSESSQETNADFLKLMHLYAATQNMNENDGESDDDDEYDFDDDDDEEDDDEDGVESAGVDYSVIKNPRFRALYEQGDQGGGLEGMMAMMQDNQQYEDEEDDDDELDEEEVGEEQKPGTLYLVSTPIGNLGEVSPRALRILSTVDVIACEDTRKTGLLLAQLGVRKKDDSQAKPLSGSGSSNSNNSNGSGNNGSEQRNRASKKQRLAMRKKAKDDKANDQEYESKLNLAYQLSGSDDSSHGNSGDCSALQLPSVSSDVDTQWQGWRDAALLSRVSASQAWKQNTTRARLISYHDHNEHTKFKDLITLLRRGKNMALVSDAGTPAISDPGFLLVNALRRLDIGVDVLPVSGPCAAIAALTISGLPTHRFAFEGFLPPKQNARIATLQNLKDEDRTLIFYESRHRITRCLADMEEVYGNTREIALVKELTKVTDITICV